MPASRSALVGWTNCWPKLTGSYVLRMREPTSAALSRAIKSGLRLQLSIPSQKIVQRLSAAFQGRNARVTFDWIPSVLDGFAVGREGRPYLDCGRPSIRSQLYGAVPIREFSGRCAVRARHARRSRLKLDRLAQGLQSAVEDDVGGMRRIGQIVVADDGSLLSESRAERLYDRNCWVEVGRSDLSLRFAVRCIDDYVLECILCEVDARDMPRIIVVN